MSSFAEQVAAFRDRVQRRLEHVVKGASSELAFNIVNDTPVDSPVGPNGEDEVWFDPNTVGEAVGGWAASLDRRLFRTTPNYDDDGGATHEEMVKVISLYHPRRNSSIHLTNAVPYIGLLEFGGYSFKERIKSTASGYSFQAPRGMVRTNTSRWKQFVKQWAQDAKRIR